VSFADACQSVLIGWKRSVREREKRKIIGESLSGGLSATMSLINDALKKAQTEEHGKKAPAAMTPSATASTGVSPAIIVGALVVVAVLGAGAYFAFSTKEEAAVKSASVEVPKVEAPVVSVKPPVVEAPKVVEVPKVVEAPKVVEPVKLVEVAPMPKENLAVRALIDAMSVSLGRKANQRAVIDGRVRQVGDQLCDNPQILLEVVDDTMLTLVDANGVRYIKRYK
jgi:hypothetical protein